MAAKKIKLLSAADVIREAYVSRQRILQIIESSDLKAKTVWRSYFIFQSDFEARSNFGRDAGRPAKVKVVGKK